MTDTLNIAILGAGLMGRALGRHWSRAGHRVRYSFARDRARLEAIAAEDGPNARAATPAEAVADADAVLVAVPWRALDALLAEAGDLSGKVALSCSLPMLPDDSALAFGHTTSGAEQLAERLPQARVASIFNTVPSELITAVFDKPPPSRPEVVCSGDDASAKRVAMALAADAGFRAIDAGPLAMARHMEPFGLLVAQLAYEQETYGGPEVGYRFFRGAPGDAAVEGMGRSD